MTEAEWLACADPQELAKAVLESPRASDRACRLFLVAFWAWQALRLPAADRDRLLRSVAATEQWAETGRLPSGNIASRASNVVFFNHDAHQAVRLTVGHPAFWHPRSPDATAVQAARLRDIFGNPFRPVMFAPEWRTETAVLLARQMYSSRDFGAMPILADALQDAGCNNEDVLNHCRGVAGGVSGEPAGGSSAQGPHVRGCWVVDLVLGKE